MRLGTGAFAACTQCAGWTSSAACAISPSVLEHPCSEHVHVSVSLSRPRSRVSVRISRGFPPRVGCCDPPLPPPHAVDPCSLRGKGAPMRRAAVPGCRLSLHVGSHGAPGYLRDASGAREDVSSLSPGPLWTKPITHGGLSHMPTMQSCVRVPTRMPLGWAGCPGGVRGTALYARCTRVMGRRRRGASASPRHLGERHGTSPAPKLSQTVRSRPFIPDRFRHFEGTDRSFALCTV
jgi:hypothetical protein